MPAIRQSNPDIDPFVNIKKAKDYSENLRHVQRNVLQREARLRAAEKKDEIVVEDHNESILAKTNDSKFSAPHRRSTIEKFIAEDAQNNQYLDLIR